ncbi:MAG TPA: AAA family ATPase [Actinomycetota bacterium]|nr:AAA family ATPase [Actinomycetota bacterium]
MNDTAILVSDPVLQALCPLAFQQRRATGSVIGRHVELAAVETELATARGGLSAICLEGEPGIGKSRLLIAGMRVADEAGFVTIAVAADEELRAPFLLMRSILPAAAAADEVAGTDAEEILARALRDLSGRTDPGLESLPADQKLLRQFDLAALALRSVSHAKPLALFVDDLQWADEDSLRALRYAVRTDAASPIFLMLALRPEETAMVTEAVTLVADMERMGMVRRLQVGRLAPTDTTAFLRQHLGGEVDAASAATVHAQAEGVPFILEELTHAYRDAGMIQQIDGVWTLARNAERLAPSAVQTLIQRRSGRLPEQTKTALSEAAVLGRSFSLKDLQAVKTRLGDPDADVGPGVMAEALTPAVATGLLVQHQGGAPADYSFSHEQVRQFSLEALSPPRRRAIHAAIVDMLTEDGEPAVESLPLLAHHAAAAGLTERCAKFSIDAARAALASNAPEEVLRAVDVALPMATGPQDRVTLLSLRDDAKDMLRQPLDRLEGLAELAALADALGDPHLELDVMLRRAAAVRLAGEDERAADLARRVQTLAGERGDAEAELAAALELGQALVRSELGEGFVPSAAEVDLDAADRAFSRAAELAEQLGDIPALAAAYRELGCVEVGRVRAWFVEQVVSGQHIPYLARAVGGEDLHDMMATLPVAGNFEASRRYHQRALDLFEQIGDRRGAMSTVIAMAYVDWAPDIHMGSNPAERIEEIRRLAMRMRTLSKESERAAADAQMAYGVHVFARAKVIPDLAVTRGTEAYWAAKTLGDRTLEFLSAGGTAMAHLDLGDVPEAERWLDLAAQAAVAAPTPLRARRLEFWRALARAGAGDADGMRQRFDRALEAAGSRVAGRCEILARRALEAARLGVEQGDDELLDLAERSAAEAKELTPVFTAHTPWGVQADAALAAVALARGDLVAAAAAGRAVVNAYQEAMHEDIYPELLIPAARAVLAAGTEEEQQMVRMFLQLLLALTAQRTVDEDVRVRWFRGPIGSEWSRLAGPVAMANGDSAKTNGALSALNDDERRLLGLLTEGLTTPQIAERLGEDEEPVRFQLQSMFAKIGASSQGEATAFALREGVL